MNVSGLSIGTVRGPHACDKDTVIDTLTSECGVRANEASRFRTQITELKTSLSGLIKLYESRYEYIVELLAENAALAAQLREGRSHCRCSYPDYSHEDKNKGLIE